MTKQTIAWVCVALLGLMPLTGCEDQVSYSGAAELNPDPDPGCNVGEELSCECPEDTEGARLCGPDGFFGACDCPDLPDREARLVVDPDALVFAAIEVGGVNARTVTITNEGDGATDARLIVGGDQFSVEDDTELRFEPGDSVEVSVLFRSEAPGQFDGVLEIVYGDAALEVALTGVAVPEQTCIEVSTERLVFPTTSLGADSVAGFEVFNCQRSTLVAQTVFTPDTDSAFELETDGELMLISPGESALVVVNFTPTRVGRVSGTIAVVSETESIEVPMVADGFDPNTCPTALAGVRVAGTDGPFIDRLTVEAPAQLAFSGEDSFDPNNINDPDAIAGYEWSVLEAPQTGVFSFVPNSAEPDPTVFLETPGRYVFSLTVINQRGEPSCEPSLVTVIVRPSGGLRVELVWETPGDPIPDDERGGDLDLHLLQDGGRWGTRPFDCHWQNVSPDWGVPGDSIDDPSFGGDLLANGPESIEIPEPQLTRFRIGVHYGRDHGFGPSRATVRVYMGDVLVFEQTREGLIDPEFWEVAEVDWEQVTVDLLDEVYPDVP